MRYQPLSKNMSAESSPPHSSTDLLWEEYSSCFDRFDDLTLARWCSQTLGQLRGSSWRLSHPLVGTYRLAAELAHERQIWHKRLVNIPNGYLEASCCRAPILPLMTRDLAETGFICKHCAEPLLTLDEVSDESTRDQLKHWTAEYSKIHQVAHWDDQQRKKCGNYDAKFEEAAKQAEIMLGKIGLVLAPALVGQFPAVIWEDQDECLEVQPSDIILRPTTDFEMD